MASWHGLRQLAVAHPKFCAALVGTLVKGMGADHPVGHRSVWYGSPQWQIEAMRRLEIPEDMQKYGFAAGRRQQRHQADFSGNAARMYNIPPKRPRTPGCRPIRDRFAALKKEHALAAAEPSNLRYGYARRLSGNWPTAAPAERKLRRRSDLRDDVRR
jgi:hypothetical protein